MKRTTHLISLTVIIFIGISLSSVASATIFASGDSTPAYYASSTGNDAFFLNILEGGTSVVAHELSSSSIGNKINNYYNSIPGLSSNYYDSFTLTSDFLLGVDLFITGLFQGELSSDELITLDNFVDSGGSVLFMGDYNYQETGINSALSYIGSGMSLYNPISDTGTNITTNIAVDPFTSGISEFTYGATYGVSGGTSLFFDSGNRAFVAYDGTTAPVPEPSTMLLLGAGLGGLMIYRRKTRK